MFDNSVILITGGTGSWGQTLTTKILEKYNPKKIIIFSRGELQQVLMQRKFNNDKIKYIIGDVRDYSAIAFATIGVDYIFHLAALKHVPICEDQPQEAVKTNIDGTINVINAAIFNKVKKVIDVSTDKAADPINLYGMTKAIGEKLIIEANNLNSDTKFVCIRGGNVMGSNGSVIPFFIQQIKNGGPVTITDFNMTRFFLTLDEAVNLLFKAAEHSVGGETFVMNMPACNILDLAKVLMKYYGDVDITEAGIRAGEKIDEILISKNEAINSYQYDSTYFVVLPKNSNDELKNKYIGLPKFCFNEFSSKSYIMDHTQIYNMLKNGGFVE